MMERVLGSWTSEEDELLVYAVNRHGTDDWKAVAALVPGRTNKACRKRWLHSLSPTLKKTAWTQAEDDILLKQYAIHGPKWSAIARHIEGRTDDACSKRYRESLDPNIKKYAWTSDEDARLYQIVAQKRGKWKEIGSELQRGTLDCRNRWRLIERKHQANYTVQQRQECSNQQQSLDERALYQQPFFNSSEYPIISHWDSSYLITNMEAARYTTPSMSASMLDAFISHPTMPPNHAYYSIKHSSYDENILSNESMDHFLGRSHISMESPEDVDASHIDFLEPSIPSATVGDTTNGVHEALLSPLSLPPVSPVQFVSEINAPSSVNFSMETVSQMYDVLNQNPSTSSPSESSNNLSPSSSPVAVSQLELPPTDTRQARSLLFSPSAIIEGQGSFSILPVKAKRLSSTQALPDESIRPYACGHPSCWAVGATSGSACFRTSADLLNHKKTSHPIDDECEKPYKCGLPDCGRSWKNLNGLQYHLQISAAHFQTALSDRLSKSQNSSVQSSPESLPEAISEPGSVTRSTKTFTCHQCSKSYRHGSGLRYHLTHGHRKKQPHQLADVPTTVQMARMKRLDARLSEPT